MPTILPSFYPRFRCEPSLCRHSCCVDWEIGIDEESLMRYRSRTDTLGQHICAHIESEEEPHFVLTDDDRCPFLQTDGLCSLIVLEGEEILPEICQEHPRFRNFYSDAVVELSTGLSCELAVDHLLKEENLHFLITSSDVTSLTKTNAYTTTPFSLQSLSGLTEDKAFLEEKYKLIFSVLAEENTLDKILRSQRYEENARKAISHLPKLETLCEDFSLLFDPSTLSDYLFSSRRPTAFSSKERNHLFVLTFFRHATVETFYSLATVASFSLFFSSLAEYLVTVKHLSKVEAIRILSAEIEYCEENTDQLLEIFDSREEIT